jgi:hypothetical protein
MIYTYYGGPADGAEIPKFLAKQDYLIVDRPIAKGKVVSYYYEKCEDHPWFEYHGEIEEEDE